MGKSIRVEGRFIEKQSQVLILNRHELSIVEHIRKGLKVESENALVIVHIRKIFEIYSNSPKS